MSAPSPSADGRRARIARVLGVVTLLLVQGGCGAILLGRTRLERRSAAQRPTRAAVRQAFEERGVVPVILAAATGMLEFFGDDEIALMSATGRRVSVRIDRDTVVIGRDGPATLADLYPGMTVVVSGASQKDGSILADALKVGRP
jgi:hypothetical protein